MTNFEDRPPPAVGAYWIKEEDYPALLKIFDDGEKYYALLMDRVSALMKQGKSLDDIKKDVKMPEYANWASQDRMPTNIDAAYRMVTAK